MKYHDIGKYHRKSAFSSFLPAKPVQAKLG